MHIKAISCDIYIYYDYNHLAVSIVQAFPDILESLKSEVTGLQLLKQKKFNLS